MTLVDTDTGEIIRPDAVVSADEQRLAAMEAHDAVRSAVEDFKRLAIAIHRGREVEAWRQDDAYQTDVASGHHDPSRFDGAFASWAAWLWEQETGNAIAATSAYNLGRAGEVLAVLNACTIGVVPQNERQLRPLTKMLTAKGVDVEERNEAIVAVWQDAIEHEGTPAMASKRIKTYAARYGGPVGSVYGPVTEAGIAAQRKQQKRKRLEELPALFDALFAEWAKADWPALKQHVTELIERHEAHRGN